MPWASANKSLQQVFTIQKNPHKMSILSAVSGEIEWEGHIWKSLWGRNKAWELQLQCQLCPWRSAAFNPTECWIRGFSIVQRHRAPNEQSVAICLLLRLSPLSSAVPSTLHCAAASAADREEEADVWSGSRWWTRSLAWMCSLNPPAGTL